MTQEATNRPPLWWAERAACVGRSDLFFSDHLATTVKKAKAICAVCVVRPECLDHAMNNIETGVWGGLTANERRVVKRKRNKQARLADTSEVNL